MERPMITSLRGLLRARLWALRQALVPLVQIAVAAGAVVVGGA